MTLKKIIPEYLKPGDMVAIVSPSFFIDEHFLSEAVTLLERWGLKVHVGKNALKQSGPFAGSDRDRLSDLQGVINDPEIKAVISARGGYGVSRIIDGIDFSPLIKDPKWFAGFSDFTVLHMWLNKVYGIISIHSEMALNFGNPEKTGETFISLRRAFFGNLETIEWEGTFHRAGNVRGEVTGGNLSMIYSVIGTKAEPNTRGTILFIEELGEYYYHIDRMLTSLKLAGKLDGLSALLIGGMNKIEEAKIPWGKSIEETIYDIVSEYTYPVCFNFPAGHVSDNRAFYIGREAQIDVSDNRAVLSYL